MVASKMVASKTKSCNNLKANNLLALKKKKKQPHFCSQNGG
jgi:hypothetical protein